MLEASAKQAQTTQIVSPSTDIQQMCDLLRAKTKAYKQLERSMTMFLNRIKANSKLIGLVKPTDFKDRHGKVLYEVQPLTGEMKTALVTVNSGMDAALEVLTEYRNTCEKQIIKIAKALPVYRWVEKIHGIGPKSLGCIIGMAGNLSAYPNPAKLWKRMGLGIVDGEIQRKAAGKIEDGGKAEKFGYSPERRAYMHIVGTNINMTSASASAGEGGSLYYEIYKERKQYELAKILPNGKPLSALHAHRRALRYVEKSILRDLWCAWNGKDIHR